MQLNESELQALQHGEPVPVVVDQKQCVLILRDAYEQASELMPREVIGRVLDEFDATEDYSAYEKR